MKHAYLIIAHNEPNILKTLLLMLDDERNDVYLHVDAVPLNCLINSKIFS